MPREAQSRAPERGRAPERRRPDARGAEPWEAASTRRPADLDPRRSRDSRPVAPQRRTPPPEAPRRGGSSTAGRPAPAAGPRTPGLVAVLGAFLVTLVAAAADSYIGIGLGTITLAALTVSSGFAALVVRRRDLVTVLVSPPLVFIGVALLNIVLAPSATFTLPTLATLLVRGFPAMAIATGAAVAVSLFRLVTRR
ncbi:DUF6542 domain-containing protein [Modestobacter roseus]|nr:DUF6542 domain-containing protein [Modestobacter roseus]